MVRQRHDNEANKLGELMRERRRTADSDSVTGTPRELSLPALADRMGNIVTRQMLWAVEKGSRRLTDPDALRALARALGNTTVEEVMTAAGYRRESGPGSITELELESVLARSGLTEAQVSEALGYITFLKEKRQSDKRKSG